MVVYGISTGEIGGFSSNLPLLTDTSIKKWSLPPSVITGILERECSSLNN